MFVSVFSQRVSEEEQVTVPKESGGKKVLKEETINYSSQVHNSYARPSSVYVCKKIMQ